MAPSPSALLALATGYQRSKVLFAFLELDLATRLAAGPEPVERIAAEVGADPLAARRFLEVCVGLGLLVRDERGYRNAPDVQHYLVRGTATDLGDLFGRHERASCSTAWARFAERLRAWRSGTHGAMSTVGVPVGPEWDGQHRLALLAGNALGEALDLRGRTRLLDLGGGTGGMSIALCRRDPALRAIVLELPAMVPVARDYVGRSGLADRIEVVAGDLVEGPLPEGCDLVLLANVLSMLSAGTSRAVLGRVHERLPADGALVLSGAMLDDGETGPLENLLFCLEDVALGAPDLERSAADYASWLARAGFERIERVSYFETLRAVVGRKAVSGAGAASRTPTG